MKKNIMIKFIKCEFFIHVTSKKNTQILIKYNIRKTEVLIRDHEIFFSFKHWRREIWFEHKIFV